MKFFSRVTSVAGVFVLALGCILARHIYSGEQIEYWALKIMICFSVGCGLLGLGLYAHYLKTAELIGEKHANFDTTQLGMIYVFVSFLFLLIPAPTKIVIIRPLDELNVPANFAPKDEHRQVPQRPPANAPWLNVPKRSEWI